QRAVPGSAQARCAAGAAVPERGSGGYRGHGPGDSLKLPCELQLRVAEAGGVQEPDGCGCGQRPDLRRAVHVCARPEIHI
ncbi:hypothetical protein IWW51_006463, partial [Coemansia sp. RSA 2702]